MSCNNDSLDFSMMYSAVMCDRADVFSYFRMHVKSQINSYALYNVGKVNFFVIQIIYLITVVQDWLR